MKQFFTFVFLAFITTQLFAQNTGSTPNFKRHIQYLASEQLEGRLTGSLGEKLAAEYIAEEFRKAGLLPAGENGTYFQKFIFEKFRLASISGNLTMTGNPTINGLEGTSTLKAYNQYYPLSVSYDTAKVISMFMKGVNFGFRESDFDGIDTIIGAAIVKLGLPSEVNPHSKEALEADLNKRIALLVRKGAKAIILCKPQTGFSDLPEKGMKARTFRTSVPVVFADTTYNYMMMHTAINFEYVVHSIMAEGINVVAKSSKKTKSHVVIGAHYDHLGRGELGGSRKDNNEIHYGADDNASGVAMIIELAKSIKNRKLKKHNYMFVAFSGEELGLIGSGKFVEFFGSEIAKTRAMLNFDMVGRIDTANPSLFLGGTGTCKTWTDLLNLVEDSTTLKIVKNPGGTGASDHTNFYYKKVPVLSFFSGLHGEYHTSSDVDSLINYQGMEVVYAYTMRIITQLNKKPFGVGTFQQVEEEKKQERAFKVTMGVMPDYGYTGKGLYISRVNPGGPAEKAGVETGDVVLRIGDHEITDIYKYMDVLKLFKKGDEAEIVVLRKGEEKRLKLVF